MISVRKNAVVAIRYIMRNSRSEAVEDNMESLPVSYLHGSTDILPGLQKQLEGLVPGDKKSVVLLAERDGSPADFTFEVIICEVREALQEEIMLGYPVLLNEKICGKDCDCYLQTV